MENVHLAVEDDDLYSGYNDYNPTFDSEVSYELLSSNLLSPSRPVAMAMEDAVLEKLGTKQR